ncbi:MAG: OB-fold nucleic acid binding domain-containing protein [Candidatus Jordarchaeum sp.]|uniref:OB-fold nucleic acid binding domain-containing protein n=1 Tax=Candidatus Jordarchaeum sp. TaxID=2823881 RepID=UPI00404976EB
MSWDRRNEDGTWKHRSPAVEKQIKDIASNEDSFIKVLGIVLEKKQNVVLIDDGTGKARIVAFDDELISKIKVGDKIRVFGTVMVGEESEIQINANIIQNVNKLSIELRSEVEQLKKSIEN